MQKEQQKEMNMKGLETGHIQNIQWSLAEKQQFPLGGVLPKPIVGECEGSDIRMEWAGAVQPPQS